MAKSTGVLPIILQLENALRIAVAKSPETADLSPEAKQALAQHVMGVFMQSEIVPPLYAEVYAVYVLGETPPEYPTQTEMESLKEQIAGLENVLTAVAELEKEAEE